MKTLSQLLDEYSSSGFYPMHMPGHKRNTDMLGNDLPYATDITEITGFDDLHAPKGVIKNIQQSLSRFYNSSESFLLVGGSTCGIMAAITSICSFGDKIIAARNCHRSVYKAIELYGLKPVWIMPEIDSETGICGEISAADIHSAIEQNSDAKLVILTSPTYEGIISDVGAISDICHKADIPLLCDMAHGSHCPLFDEFDKSYAKTDIAITSLHKTLPCLTQTACANIYSKRINTERFMSALQIFETSSPSYILMSSADKCMTLLEKRGSELALSHKKRIEHFHEAVSGMKNLKLVGSEYRRFDFTKLVIYCGNTQINGKELFGILRDQYRIECEMASARYVIAMTSICDSDEGLSRLAAALCEIDTSLTYKQSRQFLSLCAPAVSCTSYDASHAEHTVTSLACSIGRICCEYIYAYPPGVPVIAPGEVITQQAIDIITDMKKNGLNVRSAHEDGIVTALK